MTAVRLTLPDGSVREVAPGTTSREVAQSIGPGLARAAVAARVDGQIRDLDRPLQAEPASPSSPSGTRTPSTCCAIRRPTSSPPRCASSFPGRRSASARRSRTASTTTSRCRRPFTPEDLEAIEAEMPKVAARDYPFVREEVEPRRGATAASRDDPLKLERIADLGADESDLGLHRRPVRGPLPRAARADHGTAQALQAAPRRRRLLARRRTPPDAAAHLRHRLVQEGGPRRVPAPARGGQEARPPRARQGARPLHLPPRSRPGARLLDRRGTTLFNS